MSDEAELFCSDPKKRQQIADELENLKGFLRQQNPVAFLKIQQKSGIANSSDDGSTSRYRRESSLPKEFRVDEKALVAKKQDGLKVSESLSLDKSSSPSDKTPTVSKALPLPSHQESKLSKFDHLISWMRNNFPNEPLLPTFAATKSRPAPKPHPVVLLVTEFEHLKKSVSGDFLEKVSSALLHRNVAAKNLTWGQWDELADLDLSSLKLIIGPVKAKEHLIEKGFASSDQPLFLAIDWSECAQSKEKKAQLWSQIKLYLQKESR